MQTLRNKTALVTGAAAGIGRALALRLAHEGTNLHLVDIEPEGLAFVADEAKQRGATVSTRVCDVADQSEIAMCVEHGLRRWGGFDLLVNNAGTTYYGRTDQMSARALRASVRRQPARPRTLHSIVVADATRSARGTRA